METLMNLWFAFNLVFGLNTGRNYGIAIWAWLRDKQYQQSNFGRLLDLVVLVSLLTYDLTVK